LAVYCSAWKIALLNSLARATSAIVSLFNKDITTKSISL
jgi:hypothetical protein